MSQAPTRVARILDRGPIPWAVAITAWGVPGILMFYLTLLADAQFGDGEPASWIKPGTTAWLAGLNLVIIAAVIGGYWLRRITWSRAHSLRVRFPANEIDEVRLLLTAWPISGVNIVWTLFALDGDPRWLVGLTVFTFGVGVGAFLHGFLVIHAKVRRNRHEQQVKLARRKRRG